MTIETQGPATQPTASPTDPNVIEGAVTEVEAPAAGAEGASPEVEAEKPPKPEKTPEQRRIDSLQRSVDRKTRQLSEVRAQLGLTRQPIEQNNRANPGESETLSLTRAELEQMVTDRASKLAPTLRDQQSEVERRTSVVKGLETQLGKEKFDEVSSDLDDIFGGLADSNGKPKPATEAIFEADDPARVIEYLADPDNAEEAERISKLGAVQAGKAIAKLEAKLGAIPAKPKAQASKAPAPLEPVRAQGSTSAAPDPANTKAWIKWSNEQERKGT